MVVDMCILSSTISYGVRNIGSESWLLDCKPQFRPSDAIKVFKGNTARWLFLNHPELKGQLWGGHMWNPSYFVATVSERSREQIERYIKEQKTLE